MREEEKRECERSRLGEKRERKRARERRMSVCKCVRETK